MRKLVLMLLLLTIACAAQTRYYWPSPVNSSNGRPLNGQTIGVFDATADTLVATLTYATGSDGRYYSTTPIPTGTYTLKMQISGNWIAIKGHENIKYTDWSMTEIREIVGDSLNAVLVDSFKAALTVADTTELKTTTGKAGEFVYLKQLSNSNANGGGLFVYQSSGTPDGYVVVSASGGGVWVRYEHLSGLQLNAKMFGAKGDGVTDDTDAINRALTFTAGKTLYIPSGNYLISDSLSIYDNQTIIGDSQENTILNQSNTATDIIRIYKDSSVKIKNLMLKLPSSSTASGIYANTAYYIDIDNIKLSGGGVNSWGIWLDVPFEFHISNIHALNDNYLTGNGIKLSCPALGYHPGEGIIENVSLSPQGANTTMFASLGNSGTDKVMLYSVYNFLVGTSVAKPNGITGARLDWTARATFVNTDFEGIDTGWDITNTSAVSFFGFKSFDLTTAISFGTGAYNNHVFGGEFSGSIINSGGNYALTRTNKIINSDYRNELLWYKRNEIEIFDEFEGSGWHDRWYTIQAVDSVNSSGVAVIYTPAVSGDSSYMCFNSKSSLTWDNGLYFRSRVRRVDVSLSNIHFGFVATNGHKFSSATKGAWFRVLNTDANIIACVSNGTTLQTIDTGIAKGTGWKVYEIIMNYEGILFYIDGSLVATVTTGTPTKTDTYEPIYHVTTSDNVSKSIQVDYVLIKTIREDY